MVSSFCCARVMLYDHASKLNPHLLDTENHSTKTMCCKIEMLLAKTLEILILELHTPGA